MTEDEAAMVERLRTVAREADRIIGRLRPPSRYTVPRPIKEGLVDALTALQVGDVPREGPPVVRTDAGLVDEETGEVLD